MGLPIILFFFFVVIATVLLVYGMSRFSLGAGFSFTALSGIIFILVGVMLWSSGLQLDNTSSMDTSTDIISVEYNVLTYDNSPAVMLLSWFFTVGGFVPIVFSYLKAIDYKKNKFVDEWAI